MYINIYIFLYYFIWWRWMFSSFHFMCSCIYR